MSEPYFPGTAEKAADADRAELDALKSSIRDLIARWPVGAGIHLTADEVTHELAKAIIEAQQVGIDTFQYRGM